MGYNRNDRDNSPPFPTVSDADLKTIIQGGDAVKSAQLTVNRGEEVGTTSSDTATSSQIRIIFTAVRRIESEWTVNASAEEASLALRSLILMKSKLQYQAKRNPKTQDLATLLVRCIDLVNDRNTFQRFVDFFESILAYHKVGGKG